MSRIGILAIDDDDTTARYFERAVLQAGHNLVTLTTIDGPQAQSLDYLLVVDPFIVPPAKFLSVDCPVIGYVIDPHQQLVPRLAYARYLNHVFIAQPDYVSHFRAIPHPSVHSLPLACDPEVHFVPGLERAIDVGFIGKLGQPGSDRHLTLSRVLPSFTTNDFRRRYTPGEMGEVYSRAKVVFNKSINRDLNMRVFEALAAGALLVTDEIDNGLDQLGTAGVHFVTYRTIDEAIHKITYYLMHDHERTQIAAAGQELVFARHTYQHRLAEMLDVVACNPDAQSPARTADPRVEVAWRSEQMRVAGASISAGLAMLAAKHLSSAVVANAAIGVARGVIRPLRQRLQSIRGAGGPAPK